MHIYKKGEAPIVFCYSFRDWPTKGPTGGTLEMVRLFSQFYTLCNLTTLLLSQGETRRDKKQKFFTVQTDPHIDKALVDKNNESRNMRSNIKRSACPAIRAAYRSLAAFFIDLRPK